MYTDLSDHHKNLVSKIFKGYENIINDRELDNDQYILAGHELVEIEAIHDWELFRYLVYIYKYNSLLSSMCTNRPIFIM